LYPTEDAFVRNGIYAGTNFGSATVLDLKTDTEPNLTRDVYLRFDLGALASASSAKLRLSAALSASNSVTATLYPVSGAWSESSLTWNTRPGYVATALGAFTVTGTSPVWNEIDVTAYLKSELSSSRRVVSFALHASAVSIEKMILAPPKAVGRGGRGCCTHARNLEGPEYA
jgi:hypothetical protein